MHLTEHAHQLFADQHGVASVDQLREAGLSTRQIRQLEQFGSLVSVVRGSYRTPSVELTELGRCAAVSLARSGAVVSGPTAGRIWGFRRLPHDRRIHVIAPPGSNPAIAAWVVPYRTQAIHPHDIVQRHDGIRVTSRARTAFDLGRWLQGDDLLSVIEQAMHDGRISDADMVDVAIDWVSPQRPWAFRFLQQLGRRLPGGAAESHPEVLVAAVLVREGIQGLVRQFEIDLPGYGPARFDLAVPALRWAIEVDVHPTHDELPGVTSDECRDAAARSIAWHTSRISRDNYTHDLTGAARRLAAEHRRLRGR